MVEGVVLDQGFCDCLKGEKRLEIIRFGQVRKAKRGSGIKED
jgi:hypothetical protein